MFMAAKRRENISDRELEMRVLLEIKNRKGVIESELYPLSGAKYRVTNLLERLLDAGVLKMTRRTKGQRVPEYSFSDLGEVYLLANMVAYRILTSKGEIDLDSDHVVEMCDNMRQVLHVEYGEGEDGPDHEDADPDRDV